MFCQPRAAFCPRLQSIPDNIAWQRYAVMKLSRLLATSTAALFLLAGNAHADSVSVTEDSENTSNDSAVTITQVSDTLAPGNSATVYQAPGAHSAFNPVNITQNGHNNSATLNQGQGGAYIHSDNATLTQNVTGSGNSANINQGVSGSSSFDTAAITQYNTGNNDSATIYQGYEGSSSNDIAIIEQSGGTVLGNTATIWQGVNSGTSSGSEAIITQLGDGATAGIYQGTANGNASSFASIIQSDNSTATINQGTSGGGSSGDFATVSQSGGGNTATINQGVGGVSSGNFASVTQFGNDTATVDMLGNARVPVVITMAKNSPPVTIVEH